MTIHHLVSWSILKYMEWKAIKSIYEFKKACRKSVNSVYLNFKFGTMQLEYVKNIDIIPIKRYNTLEV